MEDIKIVSDFANDWDYVVYEFQVLATRDEKLFKERIVSSPSFWKPPRGKGVGWEPTFLHVALIRPSVEGKTGLDSWPFPTSAQLVHLKRPCDRNSMPQEIECSCIPVVCFRIMSLFSSLFSCFFTPFFSGNEVVELRHFSLYHPHSAWSKGFLHVMLI